MNVNGMISLCFGMTKFWGTVIHYIRFKTTNLKKSTVTLFDSMA